MPIPFNYKFKPIRTEVRLKNNLVGNDVEWLVWWYSGIYKNQISDSQPNVLVAFRELSDGRLSDNVILRRVALTSLGQLRIGTVWRDGMCRAEAVFDIEKFDVDFSKGKWRCSSFHKATEDGRNPPYPFQIYPLQYQADRNWLMEFKLSSGGKLVIPCMEFFSRCYGYSQELKRVLATYPWRKESNVHESRLYAPLDEPEESGKWKVKFCKRLVNRDVIFLAHAKYDPYTELAAKSIYGQIEALHDPEKKKPAFIRVAPWFQGAAQIKVKGIWFNNKKSFLALQIVGCTDPDGAPIQRDRENTNKTSEAADMEEAKDAWSGAPERVLNKLSEIIDLTSDADPDQSTVTVEVEDPDFEVLGMPRVVIDVRRDKAKGTAGARTKGEEAAEFSSGEAYGNGNGVGYASIHAKPVMESNGVLRDMWNAIFFLKRKYSKQIIGVEWFTFEDGFSREIEPKLIALEAFNDKDSVKDTETKNWPYLNTTTRTLRGVLVVRMMVNGKFIYIIEIQRRPRNKKNSEGKVKASEESISGLVFTLKHDDIIFTIWLRDLLSNIRYVRGIMQKLTGKCPGRAFTFRHAPAQDESVPCEAAVLNALNKIGEIMK